MATTTVTNRPSFEPKTTGVLVVLTAKPGVTREQIMKIIPAEIRATVRLYLDGTVNNGIRVATAKASSFSSTAPTWLRLTP